LICKKQKAILVGLEIKMNFNNNKKKALHIYFLTEHFSEYVYISKAIIKLNSLNISLSVTESIPPEELTI